MVERLLPLYEAKMIHQYDHRWATYDGSVDGKGQPAARDVTTAEKQDADFVALPRYWVPAGEVAKRLDGRWDRQWLMGWRDIARSTDERTVISSFVGDCESPEGGTLLVLADSREEGAMAIVPTFNSFVFDFASRQKVGGTHVKYFTMKQLPMPGRDLIENSTPFTAPDSLADWLHPRILELTYTAWDMAPFAEDLGDLDPITGRVNPPFIWDDDRRALLRAEIDAAFFHLYGITRDDVDYILDTFPIVRKHDEADHGEYRTKRLILQSYDAMAAASSGHRYTSLVTPPPGHGPRHAR